MNQKKLNNNSAVLDNHCANLEKDWNRKQTPDILILILGRIRRGSPMPDWFYRILLNVFKGARDGTRIDDVFKFNPGDDKRLLGMRLRRHIALLYRDIGVGLLSPTEKNRLLQFEIALLKNQSKNEAEKNILKKIKTPEAYKKCHLRFKRGDYEIGEIREHQAFLNGYTSILWNLYVAPGINFDEQDLSKKIKLFLEHKKSMKNFLKSRLEVFDDDLTADKMLKLKIRSLNTFDAFLNG